MKKTDVTVLGAGSWGTAIAIHLASLGNNVMLWGHQPRHIKEMKNARCNLRYLPNIRFPANLIPNANLNACVANSKIIFFAVPSYAFADILNKLPKSISGLSWLTKGMDPHSNKFLSQLVADTFSTKFPIAVISGPSFAHEVAEHLPTALTLAGNDLTYQTMIQNLLHGNNMRVYLSNDIIGVQICGTVKNVLAIACGISDGLGFGANAKAALITRGLDEMTRLGLQLGGSAATFKGLAGIGDLVLTCTNDKSRNRRFGLYVGNGLDLATAEKNIGQVIEGLHNCTQVYLIAKQWQVDMPIAFHVHAILSGQITARQAAMSLINRQQPQHE